MKNVKTNWNHQKFLALLAMILILATNTFAQDALTEGVDMDVDDVACTVSIKTAKALQNIEEISTNYFQSCNEIVFELANDIAVSPKTPDNSCTTNWNDANAVFSKISTFKGNGHTISGVCINENFDKESTISIGLFHIKQQTKIQNLKIKDVYIKVSHTYNLNTALFVQGGLVPFDIEFSSLSLEGIYLEHASPEYSYTGILLDQANGDQTISFDNIETKNITHKVSGTQKNYKTVYAGTLIGSAGNDVIIQNSNIESNIIFNSNFYSVYIGGFIGYHSSSASIPKTGTITNSSFKGKISYTFNKEGGSNNDSPNIGGIVGYSYNTSFELKDVHVNAQVNANVSATRSYVGGIIGYIANSGVNANDVSFTGEIKFNGTQDYTLGYAPEPYIGGIIGQAYNNSVSLENVNAFATNKDSSKVIISASSVPAIKEYFYLGTLVGSANTVKISNSTGKGSIQAKAITDDAKNLKDGTTYVRIGGLLGSSSDGEIRNSKYIGKISATSKGREITNYIGGIAGQTSTSAIIDNASSQGVENKDGSRTLIDLETGISLDENYKDTTTLATYISTYVGGITGSYYSNSNTNELNNSSVDGNINVQSNSEGTAYADVGGLLGVANNNSYNFDNNHFKGSLNITSYGDEPYILKVGGVAGTGVINSYQNSTAVAPKDSKLINITSNAHSIYAGGFSGESSSDVEYSAVSGDIDITATGKTSSVQVGGFTGFAGEMSSYESSHYRGKITINTEDGNSESQYVGGLAGTLAPKNDQFQVSNSYAIANDSLSTGNLIEVNHKGSQDVYAGGLCGFAGNTVSYMVRNDSKAFGGISVNTLQKTPVHMAGFIGEVETQRPGSVSLSYYVGKLFTNSTEAEISGLVNEDTPNTNFDKVYAIDLSGSAKMVGKAKDDYLNMYYVGLGNAQEAEVNLNGNVIAKTQPKSLGFASLLQEYEYNPTQNEGYPYLGNFKPNIVWIDESKVQAAIYFEDDHPRLKNGSIINQNTITKLPATEIINTENKTITYIFWSSAKNANFAKNANILWNRELLLEQPEFYSNYGQIVFFKDTISIPFSKFVTEKDDIWNGDKYILSEDNKFPLVYRKEIVATQYKRNTTWEIASDKLKNTYTANTLAELALTLQNIMQDEGISIKDLDYVLQPYGWDDVDNYTISYYYTRETQNSLTKVTAKLEGIYDLQTFNLIQNDEYKSVTIPAPSEFTFDNTTSLQFINDQNSKQIIEPKGSLAVDKNTTSIYIYLYPHLSYKISVDWEAAGVKEDEVIKAYDIPTTYDFGFNINLPLLGSTKYCFEGWMDASVSDMPATYVLYADNSRLGDITVKPVFDTKGPCGVKTIAFKYGKVDDNGSFVEIPNSNIKWDLSIGNQKIDIVNNKVELPDSWSLEYEIKAKTDANVSLFYTDGNMYRFLENKFFTSEVNEIWAIERSSLEKLSDVQKFLWKDASGQTVCTAIMVNNMLFYKEKDGTLSTDLSKLPNVYYKEKGKVYFYVEEGKETVWNGNAYNYPHQDEVIFAPREFKKSWVNFYVVDDNEDIYEISSLHDNYYVDRIDYDIGIHDSLPSLAAKFKQLNNDQFYITKSWMMYLNDFTLISSTDELLKYAIENCLSFNNLENTNLYLNTAESSVIISASVNEPLGPCDIESCKLNYFNIGVKSRNSIMFTADILGTPKTFETGVNIVENRPRFKSIDFKGINADSLMIVSANKFEEMLRYDIVSTNDEYEVPVIDPDAYQMLIISPIEEIRHKFKVSVLDIDGTIFRQFEFPENYYEGVNIELPKISTLDTYYKGYEVLDQDGNVDDYADIRPGNDGNFVLYPGVASGDLVVKPIKDETSDVGVFTVTVDGDTSATVNLAHFGKNLEQDVEDDKPVFKFPANGKWMVNVSALKKASVNVDSVALTFNGKTIKNGDDIVVEDNSIITVRTSIISDSSDLLQYFEIAADSVLLSGSAMRFPIKVSARNKNITASLTTRIYKNNKLFKDSLLVKSTNGGDYTFDYYPLPTGSYKVEFELTNEIGSIKGVSNDFEIRSSDTLKADTWYIKSLANVTENFEIPEDSNGAVFYWNEKNALGDYLQYRKVYNKDSLVAYQGYWIISDKSTQIDRKEISKPQEDSLVWNLKNEINGWNMVANPYSWNLSLGTADFESPNDSNIFWRWNPSIANYDTARTANAYEGLWIQASKDQEVKLSNKPSFISGKDRPKNFGKKSSASTRDSWSLRLILNGENGTADSWNVVGVGLSEINLEEPPAPMEGGVNLTIENGNRRLAKSIHNSLDNTSWKIAMSAASLQSGKLTVKNLDALEQMGLYASLSFDGNVIPLKAGEDVDLKLSTVPTIATLNVSPIPAIAVKKGINGLGFDNSGSKMAVTFALGGGYSAEVDVRLITANGNVVSKTKEEAWAGKHKILLDKPNSSGIYVLRVTAGNDSKQILVKF